MNNDLYKAGIGQSILDTPENLNTLLNGRLAKLAEKWGVSEMDPKIAEIGKSAQFAFLGRTSLTLTRIRNNSPFKEHQSYFESLTAQNFAPKLYGVAIQAGSSEEAEAKKLLKDLAYYVGGSILYEQAQKQKAALHLSKAPVWINTGLVPTDHGIEVTESQLPHHEIDWGAETIPAPLSPDESSRINDEKDNISKIINGASPLDLKRYLQTTLRPRFAEVFTELRNRRQKYHTPTGFELQEGALINFKKSLGEFIQHALHKIKASAVDAENNITPFPTLISKDKAVQPPEMTAPKTTATPAALQAKLDALQARITNHVGALSGQNLRQFYEGPLKAKALTLKTEIDDLKRNGNDPTTLHIKEKHMGVIVAGLAATYDKIMDEHRASHPIAKVTSSTPISVRTPPANIGFIPTLTDVVTPAQAAAAQAAFLIATTQDRARATLSRIPVLAEVIEFPRAAQKKVQDAKATPPAAAPLQIGFKDDGITTVEFKEVIPSAEPKKQGSWLKKAATKVAIGAAWAVGGVAIFFGGAFLGVMGKIAYQDHVRDGKIAAAATAQFNQAAEASAAQRAVDLAKETGYYNPLAQNVAKATPAPVEAKTVEAKQPVSEPKVAKAPSTVKAKADFRPAAAANDDQVTYNNAIISKPFDILSSRIGLDTLNNACRFLKANGTTVENGICPQ